MQELVDTRAEGNQAVFAAMIKRSPSVVWQYLSGHREMGEKLARHIESVLRLPSGWMDTDASESAAAPPTPTPSASSAGLPILTWENPEDLPAGQYVMIPRRRVAFSAGNGHLSFEEEEAPPLAFGTAWVRRVGLRAEDAVVVYARGDSMEPGIRDGDVLLVDLAPRDIADGDVYALRYSEQLRVKRLFRRYDGALILRSDNAAKYPDEIVPPQDQDGHVHVIGRVIWRGGDL